MSDTNDDAGAETARSELVERLLLNASSQAAEIERLRGALREIEAFLEPLNEGRYSGNALNHTRDIARAALGGSDE